MGGLDSQAVAQNLFFGNIGRAGATLDYLFTSDLNGGGLANILPAPGAPIGVDVDPHLRRVFWQDSLPFLGTGLGPSEIRSSSLTGSSPTVVASLPSYTTYGLAVDAVNQRVYWANGTTIQGSDYNGANLLTVASGIVPSAIEVDPSAGKLFFTDQGLATNASVGVVNLNGTGQGVLVNLASSPVAIPSGISVDPVSKTIFFSDYSAGTISTVPYTGGVPTPLYTGLPGPAGLDWEPTTGRLYLADNQGGTIQWGTPLGAPLTTVFTVTPQTRGEMWDVAAIIPDPQPVTISGLRNFDIVSPFDVNDFHITLRGINDPLLAANGGTQIQSVFPAPFNNVLGAPTGWYPPAISTSGNTTVISYGGPGAQFVSNRSLHFGVSLTPAGEAALQEICMHWTRDGVPFFAGGDANLPLTIIPDQAAPGETDIQIVNQICSDGMVVGPNRWLGPVYLEVIDRHADLDELVNDSPIIVDAEVWLDGTTYLAAGEQLRLSNVDALTPATEGKSIIVWYDVFEDNAGTIGRFVGTSYTAFNVVAVPEPFAWILLSLGAISVEFTRRRRLVTDRSNRMTPVGKDPSCTR